jgi:lysine-specific demethylase 8/hypoxia-inducible factor 1-alpha inhibitor (HIF hydroxylase)
MTTATLTRDLTTTASDDRSAIDRVPLSTITPELFYRKYRSQSKPFIITGAFEGVEDWTLETIEAKLGDGEYGVRIYGRDYRSRPKREWKKYSEAKSLTVKEYIRMLHDRSAHEDSVYMAQVAFGHTPLAATIRHAVLEIERRFEMAPIVPQMDLNLWLGPAGHTEPLHFDTGDGTLMQLHGAKRIALFPPSQTKNLYPFDFFREIPPWFSRVDTDGPDPAEFPGYGEALKHRLDVVVEEGEILFIPVSWWHEVTALGSDYVCSVNRFWKVAPFRRNFSHGRSSVFWLMNQLPWKWVLAFDGTMRKVLKRPSM